MRLLSKKQLKELGPYSSAHVQRLENADLFPKRVRLGELALKFETHDVLPTVRDQRTQLFPIDNPFHRAYSDMEPCTASGLKNGPEPRLV